MASPPRQVGVLLDALKQLEKPTRPIRRALKASITFGTNKEAMREFWKKFNKSPAMDKTTAEMALDHVKQGIKLDQSRIRASECVKAADKLKKPEDYAATLVSKVNGPAVEGKDPKIKVPEEARKKINEKLKNSDGMTAAIKQFKDTIEEQNKRILSKQLDPSTQRDQLYVARADLVKAMTAQHAQETTDLKALLADPAFLPTLDEPDPAKAKIITASMESALQKSHKEQLDNLNAEVTPNLDRMHAITQRAEAMALLCTIMSKNKENAQFFKRLRESQEANNPNDLVVGQQDPNDPMRFLGADLDDLAEDNPDGTKGRKTFETNSGKLTVVSPDGKKINLSSSKFGFGVTADDMLCIALAGKAMGWKTIQMDISHSNTNGKAQQRMVKDAIVAGLKAGYTLDEITIRTKNEKGEFVAMKREEMEALGEEVTGTKSLLSDKPTKDQSEYKDFVGDVRKYQAVDLNKTANNTIIGPDDQPPAARVS